jgi:hypothetical protein
MSLVTLIRSAETHLRDAVVQIEEWYLPLEAKFTGEVDAAGRRVYTLLANVVSEVKTEAKKVETAVVNEAEKVKSEVESLFEKANTVNTAPVETVNTTPVETANTETTPHVENK